MLEKINSILSSKIAVTLGGICLVMSFFLPRMGYDVKIDPAWVTVFICGIPLLYLSLWRVVHNPGISKISSALLITIAMIAAILIGDLFAAGEVAFIMALGAILEDMTTDRAKKGLKRLISLTPVSGRRITEGREEEIPAEEIKKGDILRILPGETIPVDGIIVKGETSVDQSIMTGESIPVDKREGEEVYCGTVNSFGSFDMRASKVGNDTSLQKLIRMVEEAEDKKAPMARIADTAAVYLVPFIVVVAILTGIFTKDIVRCVTVLVVFCPCALVLATPTAIMAAIGQATKHGVIIKSGEALEKMGRVDTIAFDKTGTLTYGKLEVSDIISFDDGLSEEELLSLTASLENKSEHPLGKAIVNDAKKKSLVLTESESFKMTAGRGIEASVKNTAYICGSEDFLKEKGIETDEKVTTSLNKLRSEGRASVLIARGNTCIGLIALSDKVREDAPDAAGKLKAMGTDIVLLTGDNKTTASYFAGKVGIKNVYSQLLPEEKVGCIVKMKEEGKNVCMIGDGVNDAPALKTADVGVAMGSMGSDIAIEAADIALMSDDISRLPYLKKLSNATASTIKFGITLSMCINFVAVTLSVMGILTPTTGALVHNAGSCLVVLIAALLYDRKF